MAGAAPAGPLFAVFRSPSFARAWSAQTVSTIGDASTTLAAGVLVYRLTGSVLGVALTLMATALPALLFGLVGGAVVDRCDRRRVMVVAQLLRAALVGAIPLLAPHGLVWLFVPLALAASAGQFFAPAYESVLPELAPKGGLAAANAFVAIGTFGSAALGFAVAGALAAGPHLAWAFALDAATFVISALLVLGVRVEPLARNGGRDTDGGASLAVRGRQAARAVLANLREGARATTREPALRSLLILTVPTSVAVGAWEVVALPFVERALGAGSFVYGLQEALGALGFVAGALIIAAFASRLSEGRWIVVSLVGSGLAGLAYAAQAAVAPALLLIALTGLFDAPDEVARRLLVQRGTRRELRGRVYSVLFLARDLSLVAGMALAGLADLVGVRLAFAAAAALLLACGGLAAVLPGVGAPATRAARPPRPAAARRAPVGPRRAFGAPAGVAVRPATMADLLALAGRNPALAGSAPSLLRDLAARTRVVHAPAGADLVRRGEPGDRGFFLIDGRAVAAWDDDGRPRTLGTLAAGDVFGEIGALTGAARTADVRVEEDATLLEVPAAAMRGLAGDPALRRMLLRGMHERLGRMDRIVVPRRAGVDPDVLRDLRARLAPAPRPSGPARSGAARAGGRPGATEVERSPGAGPPTVC